MADLKGVELARPGVWPLATGQTEFTAGHLRDAADFFADTGGQKIPIALGHNDPRFSGDPSFGNVDNVRYEEDDRGPVLVADLTDMPDWLHAAAPKRWPNRSIEGFQGFEYGGRTYKLVLTALALLGVTPPGVRSIKSLTDLKLAVAASSARRIVATPAPPDAYSSGGEMIKPWGSDDPVTWARVTGRIAAASERSWRADHLCDPAGTEWWLALLHPLPEVAELQAISARLQIHAEQAQDEEYARLWPPTHQALQASLAAEDAQWDAEYAHLFQRYDGH